MGTQVAQWLENENAEALNKDQDMLMNEYPDMVLYDMIEFHQNRTMIRLSKSFGEVTHLEAQVVEHVRDWWNNRFLFSSL